MTESCQRNYDTTSDYRGRTRGVKWVFHRDILRTCDAKETVEDQPPEPRCKFFQHKLDCKIIEDNIQTMSMKSIVGYKYEGEKGSESSREKRRKEELILGDSSRTSQLVPEAS